MINSICKDYFNIDYITSDKKILGERISLKDLVLLINETNKKISNVVVKEKLIKFYRNRNEYANIYFSSENDLLFVLSRVNISNKEK